MTALVPQSQPLIFRGSTAVTKSLWLAPNATDAKRGALVSPQAELFWLHPNGKTVAFTLNGVLFIRTLRDSNR